MREPVIVDVVRTAFGKRGGALANWHPADLLGFALTTLIERTGVDPERIDDVIGGCVSQVGEQSTNLARNGWVSAGLPAMARINQFRQARASSMYPVFKSANKVNVASRSQQKR